MWVTTSDGLCLAVRVTEAPVAGAPTVLCVHGYPDDGSLWAPVAARLARRYRVVTMDVRGAGESQAPRSRAGYALDQLAADLRAVAEAVADEPVHLLAHDWGSIQAWHAVTGADAARWFASFTSISGPCLDHVGHWARRVSGAGLRQLAHSWYVGFFHLPVLPELTWRSGLGTRLMAVLDATAGRPDRGDAVRGLELYRANVRRAVTAPGARSTELPVQVLAPSGDAFVGAAMQGAAARWAPNLFLRRVPGGHWLPRAAPELVADVAGELVEHVTRGVTGGALGRASVRSRRSRPGRFAGKLVVVTGFGNGIGQATAVAFARAGADVVGCDIDGVAADESARLVRAAGGRSAGYPVDVGDAAAMERFAARVRAEHGVADIVVNNAGIGMSGPFLDTTVADWRAVLDVNLWGVIHGARLFAAQMAERGTGGQVVNIASAAAYTPSRLLPAYAATKAAVLALSECLRGELAERGIGVTAVCPGVVNSAITGTSRFVGVDDAEQHRRRERASRAYARRDYSTERTARAILRAVAANRALAPVTPEAHVGLALSRLAPAVMRRGARLTIGK